MYPPFDFVANNRQPMSLTSAPLTEPYLRFSRIRLFKLSSAASPNILLMPYSPCILYHPLWPLVPRMLPPQGPTTCCPLRSTCFYTLLRYYEAVRLLASRQVLSIYQTSIPLTDSHRSLSDLPGIHVLP
jgi:hypothetical protein